MEVNKILNKLTFGYSEAELLEFKNNIKTIEDYKGWIKKQIFNLEEDIDIEKHYNTLYDKDFFKLYMDSNIDANFCYELLYKNLERRIFQNINSKNKIKELTVNFLLNHFYICPSEDTVSSLFYEAFEKKIRNNVFGNFNDILKIVMQDVCMLAYLNNTNNIYAKKINFINFNENFARELLELHTIGIESKYEQKDVISVTKILTGHGRANTFRPYDNDSNMSVSLKEKIENIKTYDEMKLFLNYKYNLTNTNIVLKDYYLFNGSEHDYSDKFFMGNKIEAKGVGELDELILLLNKNNKIAKFISKKLCLYFLGKEPSQQLYNDTVNSFIKNNGNLGNVIYDLLVNEEYIHDLFSTKDFKSPYKYMLSTSKYWCEKIDKKEVEILARYLHNIGGSVFSKITPDGINVINEKWNNFGRLQQYSDFFNVLYSTDYFKQNTKFNPVDFKRFALSEKWIFA